MTAGPAGGTPVRVLRGRPTDAEVAAVLAAMLGLAARPGPGRDPGRVGGWADPAVVLRIPPRPGRTSWWSATAH